MDDSEISFGLTVVGVVMRVNSMLIIQSNLQNCWPLWTGCHVISNPCTENMGLVNSSSDW